jgi:hypothetical protein
MAQRLPRIVALRKAGELMGQVALAAGMGIAERSLRKYLGADRRITSFTLNAAAKVLEHRAGLLTAHAARLRALAEDAPE